MTLQSSKNVSSIAHTESSPMTIQRSQNLSAIAPAVVCLVLLIAKLIVQIKAPDAKFDDAFTIGLIVIAALPWLARLLESMKLGSVEVKFRELEAEQRQQEVSLKQHAHYLTQLFHGMIGERGRDVMQRINDSNDSNACIYEFSEDTKQEYRTALRQLRLLGFIELNNNKSVSDIIDDRVRKIDLLQEVTITPSGRAFMTSQVATTLFKQ